MMILKIIGAIVVALLLAWAGTLAWLSVTSPLPVVRLVGDRLRPCPSTPNCVSSESGDPASQVEPLRFQGAPEAAWADLESAITALGGTIVAKRDGFLWATFTSRIFRFVDDMEFRLAAEEGVIQLRSGARVGRSDMGVNRKRVEKLRALFQQRQG